MLFLRALLALLSISVSVSSSSLSSSVDVTPANAIERRGCTRASQCHSKLVKNQVHTCVHHACKKACKSGYKLSKGKCVKKKTGSAGTGTGGGSTSASVTELLRKQGISGFLDVNGPGIASWYRTNSRQDSTNVLNNFGGSWEAAGKAYCGLEAKVTTPDGKTVYLYIADGFDPAWIRKKGSIDVISGSFAKLYGEWTQDKNHVVQGIKWELTGARSKKYSFKGPGSG
ncbi:hypothetical protein RQP46_001544 [Phenoliferia psychrophenolica]